MLHPCKGKFEEDGEEVLSPEGLETSELVQGRQEGLCTSLVTACGWRGKQTVSAPRGTHSSTCTRMTRADKSLRGPTTGYLKDLLINIAKSLLHNCMASLMLSFIGNNQIRIDTSISALGAEDYSKVSLAFITTRTVPAKNHINGTKHPINHHPTLHGISETNRHEWVHWDS